MIYGPNKNTNMFMVLINTSVLLPYSDCWLASLKPRREIGVEICKDEIIIVKGSAFD